jgi:fibronectin type 3 domain-containing protein
LQASAVSNTQINLTWSNVANETGYRIERKTGTGGTFAEIGTVGANVTSFSSTGLSANTTYCYRVRAFNDAGNSGFSNESCATTLGPPAAPSNLQASAASSSQINLTWNDNSNNETQFRIERRIGGGAYVFLVNKAAGSTSHSDAGLSSNTTYTYRARGK